MSHFEKFIRLYAPVENVDKAKAFYADTLGLKIVDDTAFGAQRWVTVELPGAISFVLSNVHENMKPGMLKLYLTTPDVEATYKELIGKGVKPAQALSDGWNKWKGENGKWFELRDPDGNSLLIIPPE